MSSDGGKATPDALSASAEDGHLKNQSHQSKMPTESKPVDKSKQSSDGDGNADFGYDLYPERQGGKYKPSFWEHFFLHEGENLSDQITCEKNVYNCFKKSKLLCIMFGADKVCQENLCSKNPCLTDCDIASCLIVISFCQVNQCHEGRWPFSTHVGC